MTQTNDQFTVATEGFFEKAHSNAKGVMVTLGVLFAIGLGATLLMNRREAKSTEARDAYYKAQQALEKESAAVSAAEPKAADAPTKDNKAKSAPEISFKKLDVESKYPETVKGLKEVVSKYDGTRSAYEARMTLGNLYYDHGDAAKAVPFFEEAANAAPGSVEKVLTFYSLGYALENSGKYQDAIQSYQKALNLGELNMKGELLLAIGRCYELLHDQAKAKSTYEQIITQLPDSEYAKTAELRKSQSL